MKIKTSIGKIEVKESNDGVNKGVWIEINGIGLVLVEHDAMEDKHVIRVWNSNDPGNDYDYKQVISKSKKVFKEFQNEVYKAIDDYGDDCIDIGIDEGVVYGFYHSRHDSFPVTCNYDLNKLGGIEALKAFEEDCNGLVAICHME